MLFIACGEVVAQQAPPADSAPIDRPEGFERPQVGVQLIETSRFIRVEDARQQYQVSGTGLTAAVLDTGLRATHVDFLGRVAAQKNFTPDNGADPENATDGNGHGTNVGGIIVANRDHIGIAPGARIIPLKVLRNSGSGSFASMAQALQWVIDNHNQHQITVVNMSLGDSGNYQDDGFGTDDMGTRIASLRALRIPVVISAGNDFHRHMSREGMGYPGIFRASISVGAVYDADEGPFSYASGATANSTGPGRFTPFSQRLHESTNAATRTDIFAPGAPVTSSGHLSDNGESIQHGTSQAAPVVAGVILLMQEFYQRQTGVLPEVDSLEQWLRQGGVPINDGDDEDDNVTNTGKSFVRLDALGSLEAAHRSMRKDLLMNRANAASLK